MVDIRVVIMFCLLEVRSIHDMVRWQQVPRNPRCCQRPVSASPRMQRTSKEEKEGIEYW